MHYESKQLPNDNQDFLATSVAGKFRNVTFGHGPSCDGQLAHRQTEA
jgi:hypothetical protein